VQDSEKGIAAISSVSLKHSSKHEDCDRMNHMMPEDSSTPRDTVYICIAESQLNTVMKNLESTQRRCARQSLAMVTAGHDLRQHIQIIRAALENLESAETVLANQWIDTAKEQARRLEDEALHLVENARLDVESMNFQVAPFSIEDTLRRIDRDWRVFAASKALALKVRPCTTMVVSDRRLLSVILDNLVANSVKYTNDGQINVDCIRQGDCLLVSVKDTGPGISRQDLERFAQAACQPLLNTSGSGMSMGMGLGLGLEIIHRSAALLGHEINVASIPGIGSCVTVKVPLATSTANEPLAFGIAQHGSTRLA
jgi:signal transduction histidine kinase